MRLEILNEGYAFAARLLFAVVRLVSGHPLPDAAKLVFYRPDFYGSRMKELTHEAMRGPSPWSVADRELMAAFVSKANQCAFCIGAHTATATRADGDPSRVAAALSDPESAPIEKRLRATLRMLGKLQKQHSLEADDMRELLSNGVTRREIEDALAVYFVFSVTNRLADAFGFEVLNPEGFDAGAKVLLARGARNGERLDLPADRHTDHRVGGRAEFYVQAFRLVSDMQDQWPDSFAVLRDRIRGPEVCPNCHERWILFLRFFDPLGKNTGRLSMTEFAEGHASH